MFQNKITLVLVSVIVILSISIVCLSANKDYPGIEGYRTETKAMAVGDCEMQDFVLIYIDDKLIDKYPIGTTMPQSERFKSKYPGICNQ